jgi:hypothetical protein
MDRASYFRTQEKGCRVLAFGRLYGAGVYIPYQRTLMVWSRVRLVPIPGKPGKVSPRCPSGYVVEVLILKMKPQWAVLRALFREPVVVDIFAGKTTGGQEVKRINNPMVESIHKRVSYIDLRSPFAFEAIREEVDRAQKICDELNQPKESK